MRAADLLGPTGPLARVIPGYEYRQGQLEMADAVQRTLEDDRVLMVEAGTGTGKTLAYLLPAILSGKKIIVSTGTRTLQDQIMDHDVPLLAEHLGVPVRAAMMKGLSNYLCLRRYHDFVASPAASDRRFKKALPLLDAFRNEVPTGDKSMLEGLAEDDPVWARVTSGSDTRVGRGCKYHDACFVTRMKQAAKDARIVVVNHHLFFADMVLREGHGGVLPDYDAVIFDEAHQIEDTATRFFGHQVSSGAIEKLVQDIARGDGADAAQQLAAAAGLFFAKLPGARGARTPLSPEVFSGEVEDALFGLDNALERVERAADDRLNEIDTSSADMNAASQMVRRVHTLRDDLIAIAETRNLGTSVAWSEPRGRHHAIGTSPVDISETLRDGLLLRTRSVVLTSATLTTSDDEKGFDFIKARLGVDFDADQLIVPSPFDYAHQAALYLPPDMPDPRSDAYLERAREEITSLIELTGGGAFVLCTSLRQMRRLSEECAFDIPHPVLVQGQAPKQALLTRFRAAGDAVLFATMSFWEGVDVPGDALRLVIVDKLPFGVPTDPLISARCDALRDKGVQPFMKYLVPSAALTLKQGFGRLIRSKRDRGVVALLDGRVTQKGYGKAFLRALPPATRCTTLDEVRAAIDAQREDDESEPPC